MARIQIERGVSFKKILYSWPVIVIFIVILGALASRAFRSWQNYRVATGEYEKLQEKIEETEENKKKAEENLALLKDESSRDRVIREQFNLQKNGEKVIIVLDGDERQAKDFESASRSSVFLQIKNFIKNIFSRD